LEKSLKKYKKQIGVGGVILTEYEKSLVNEVLASNRLTYGPMSRRFESEFAHAHQVKHALFMNSGTSALHIGLAALKERHGWSDGDEVIIPAITFVATANIVLHNNMVPVFVDVEPDTFNINPKKIEDKITKRTKAIIPVHLLGLPASMQMIWDIADRYCLEIIEDSCETMFATYKGKSVGNLGSLAAFSTYVAHFLVTGVGGFATTNDKDLAVDMRSLMNHGRDGIYISCSDDEGKEGQELAEVIKKRFSFVHVGHSFRCTELEAAIGVGQLARSVEVINRRLEIAARFSQELKEFEDRLQLPSCPDDRTHSYMLYGLVLRDTHKKKLVNFLENLNIETRDLLPLINQPIYKRLYGDLEKENPVAKHINESGFYIGCHSYMDTEEVDFVINAFRNYFRNS
jgi:perosamine synthetase